MLKNILITKWTSFRDSSKRVTSLDGDFREYIINTKNISDIVDISSSTYPVKSRFFYSDNPQDRREGLSVVEALISPTNLKTAMDASPASNAVTLRVRKDNDVDGAVIETSILVDKIVYVDRYNYSPDTHCWVVYMKGAFKRAKVLVDHGLEAFIDIIQTGTTTPA